MTTLRFQTRGIEFSGISKINILIGKNGCGKSSALRNLDQHGQVVDPAGTTHKSRYLSPERGGVVKFEASQDQSILQNESHLPNHRRHNQAQAFRVQSASLFKKLETKVLREIAGPKRLELTYTFQSYLDRINKLFDRIEIYTVESDPFKIRIKGTTSEILPEQLSSGESELLSLAFESLSYASECAPGTENILIIDEPDVHLHPDLQVRLMGFLNDVVNESNFRLIISTHSTPILSAFSDNRAASIAFMKRGDQKIAFSPITLSLKALLPVFGAHPLSSVFNKHPVFIVEGADEERIWQQATRTSGGLIKLFPVECGGKGNMNDFENESNSVIASIYENARGYSLRDADGETAELDDLQSIVRFRLKCRTSENLILTDEVLSSGEASWDQLLEGLKNWLNANANHKFAQDLQGFLGSGDRMNHDIKNIRNIIAGVLPTNKPWEVLVGKTIANCKYSNDAQFETGNGIHRFLGRKLCQAILPPA